MRLPFRHPGVKMDSETMLADSVGKIKRKLRTVDYLIT